MNNVWKKETTQAGSVYVDLFASIPQNERNFPEVIKLAERLKSYHSVKDNEKATEFRMQGNVEFRMKNWPKAMQLYNQSLYFAEVGGEEVAMVYANRSACFFHMQKYDEVLADIELAKSVNLPDRLVSKLEQRKQESLKMKAKVESPTKRVPQLSYSANQNYPCLAEVVDIKRNDEYGRHLVATQDIPVGKVLLLEKDLVAIRNDKSLACETCFREDANFIACPKCADVVFCSIECMNRNLTHNWECGLFPNLIQDDNFEAYYKIVKYQIRILFMALEIFGNMERLMEFVDVVLKENPDTLPTSLQDSQSQYHFFFKLKRSMPLSEHFAKYCAIYKGVHSLPTINALFNTEKKQRFLGHLVSHHFMVVQTNSVEKRVTQSVVNVLSMLNHSCHPNLCTTYIGKHHCCITIRPIKKGDQLFIDYLQGKMESGSSKNRQELFKVKWSFVCKCDRCNMSTDDREDVAISSDPKFCFVRLNYEDDKQASIVMENCVQLLSKYGKQPWSLELSVVANTYISLLLEQMH